MIIKETQHTYTYLNLYRHLTDVIICSRIIPHNANGSFCEKWRDSQLEDLIFIEERFFQLPILKVPVLKNELVKTEALEEIGRYLYDEDDPACILFKGKAMSIDRESMGYLPTLPVPFVTYGDVSLMKNGDELVATIGNQRQSIFLPQILLCCELKGVKLDDGYLLIRFGASEDNHR